MLIKNIKEITFLIKSFDFLLNYNIIFMICYKKFDKIEKNIKVKNDRN